MSDHYEPPRPDPRDERGANRLAWFIAVVVIFCMVGGGWAALKMIGLVA